MSHKLAAKEQILAASPAGGPPKRLEATSQDEEIKILLQQLKEERDKNAWMSQQYEKQLCQVRAENVTRIAQARAQVLAEVDDTIKKYHRLAVEAIRAGKQATIEAEAQEKEIKKISEQACQRFEQDCKEKLREVLDGYRYLADKAAQQADLETRAMREKYQELEEAQMLAAKTFEGRLLENTESQVAPYKAEIMRLESENRQLRQENEYLFVDIKDEALRGFERFETTLISQALSLLWERNIPITEEEFRERINETIENAVGGFSSGLDEAKD